MTFFYSFEALNLVPPIHSLNFWMLAQHDFMVVKESLNISGLYWGSSVIVSEEKTFKFSGFRTWFSFVCLMEFWWPCPTRSGSEGRFG